MIAGLALLLGTACLHRAPEPMLRQRGVVPARSTTDALNAALAPRRVALLVGIDTYEDTAFPTLRHAAHDAEALAGVLRDPMGGGFDEIELLSGGPNRERVVRSLQSLARELRREDVVIVYFSGHGTRVRADGTTRRYLLQGDSRAADLETTALDLEALQQWFSGLPAARKGLIVDACFNGDGKSVVRPAGRDLPVPETFAPPTTVLGMGEAHLFATSPGRPALEDDQLAHGVYSYFMIEALSWGFRDADRDADGLVTAWEAHDYARSRVMERTSGVQVPEASFRVVGMADLVLTGHPRSRTQRDQALVYLYPPPSHPLSGATLSIDGRPRGSIPGTVAVPPGRHHVALADAAGNLVAQGHLTLSSGRPYRAEDLQRLLRGPSLGIGVRPRLVGNPSQGLAPALGNVVQGVELHTYVRDAEAPGRGAVLGVGLGLGTASRVVDGSIDARVVGDLSLFAGVQRDWRRLRLRVGATVGATWLPADAHDPPPRGAGPHASPSEAGWVFLSGGPDLTLGLVASETWSFGLQARLALTSIDADGDGSATAEAFTSVSVGPEWVIR